MKFTTEQFIESCNKTHKNKYGYKKVQYINAKEKVEIICPEHGSFWQNANSHKRGCGCPACAGNKKSKLNEFIKKAKQVHGDRYDYSKVIYTGAKSLINIICKDHGPFTQSPTNHLCGKKCRKCSMSERRLKEIDQIKIDWIESSKIIHNNRYNYDDVKYISSKEDVEITCTKHGVFLQSPSNHLRGSGCAFCAGSRFHKEEFLNNAKKVHGDRYDYSKIKKYRTDGKVELICKKHGSFWQDNFWHLNGSNCPKCTSVVSSYELKIIKFLFEKLPDDTITNSVKTIEKITEIDILNETKKIGIEFNGLYWHSDKFKDKNYHISKTHQMNKQGFDLIHIFEDEWLEKEEICKSIILNRMGETQNRLYARKLEIKPVQKEEERLFLEQNHIKGSVPSSHAYGLYDKIGLVSILTFGKKRIALGSTHKEGEFELLRLCSKINTSVIGGFSRLLKHAESDINPDKIITYCDLRWFNGSGYLKCGFEQVAQTAVNYFYIKNNKRINRFSYRKSLLHKKLDNYDPELTEKQNMHNNGFRRIYDCGNLKLEKVYNK